MKQLLLATALIALPVAAFTGFNAYQAKATVAADAPAASLGDLSAFHVIIADVQSIVASGNLAAAKTRIKDFEIAWDQAEPGLRSKDPAHWGLIDEAADGALSSLRAGRPDPTQVSERLVALKATLQSAAPVSK